MLVFSLVVSVICFLSTEKEDPIHEDITKEALKPLGFTDDAIKDIQKYNANVDSDGSFFWSAITGALSNWHYLENNLTAGSYQILTEVANIKQCYFTNWCRSYFGYALHIIQDFFSHSTWVHIMGDETCELLLNTARGYGSVPTSAPSWYEPCPNRPDVIEGTDYITSADYYWWDAVVQKYLDPESLWKESCTKKCYGYSGPAPGGVCYHGFCRCNGINLDTTHYSYVDPDLYDIAVKLAVNHTKIWSSIVLNQLTDSQRKTIMGTSTKVEKGDVFVEWMEIFSEESGQNMRSNVSFVEHPLVLKDEYSLRFSLLHSCEMETFSPEVIKISFGLDHEEMEKIEFGDVELVSKDKDCYFGRRNSRYKVRLSTKEPIIFTLPDVLLVMDDGSHKELDWVQEEKKKDGYKFSCFGLSLKPIGLYNDRIGVEVFHVCEVGTASFTVELKVEEEKTTSPCFENYKSFNFELESSFSKKKTILIQTDPHCVFPLERRVEVVLRDLESRESLNRIDLPQIHPRW